MFSNDYTDLNVIAVETEMIAIFRAISREMKDMQSSMVVMLGSQNTSISIIYRGKLSLIRSINAGGEAFARAVAEKLNINVIQAQQYLRAYGLEKDKLEGKIYDAVQPIMKSIVRELKRSVASHQDSHREDNITSMFLCGGTSQLPGMVVAFAEEMNTEVQIANPWYGVQISEKQRNVEKKAPDYITAIGLALR